MFKDTDWIRIQAPSMEPLNGNPDARGSPVPTAWLGETFAAAGKKDGAVKILQELETLGKHQYLTPCGITRIYAGLGERDETFRWLESAFEERADWMVLLSIDPCFDDYHSAPLFRI